MSESPKVMSETVKELVAIGAAMAANCEPCFRNHFNKAIGLGLDRADIRAAVDVALAVKATPHRLVVQTAERYLAGQPEAESEGSGCGCASSSCS